MDILLHRLAIGHCKKEENLLDLFVLIGLSVVLLLIGGFFVYFLKSTLNVSDSSTIDPIPEEENPSESQDK